MLKTLGFVAVTVIAAASAPAHARLSANGLSLNGASLNGLQLNGVILNGMKMNGMHLNGTRLNGLNVNGFNLDTGTGALQATRLALPDGTVLNFR